MKIGIVTGEISLYPPFGGIATASEGLARSLRAAGLEVDLLFFPEERVAERRPDDEARIGLRFFDMRRADSFKRQRRRAVPMRPISISPTKLPTTCCCGPTIADSATTRWRPRDRRPLSPRLDISF